MSTNPYAPPGAPVSDIVPNQQYQEIRMWSASGRIGRLRYLAYSMGPSLLVGLFAGAVSAATGPAVGGVLTLVAYIPVIVFSILAGIKRSHDMNWSGWTVLLTLIPIVGLIWIFKAGTNGENRFGAPPPPNTTGVKLLGILMPILFLIGIIAAIAIPAYVQYTNRAMGVQ